jgi:hypothetical protein
LECVIRMRLKLMRANLAHVAEVYYYIISYIMLEHNKYVNLVGYPEVLTGFSVCLSWLI